MVGVCVARAVCVREPGLKPWCGGRVPCSCVVSAVRAMWPPSGLGDQGGLGIGTPRNVDSVWRVVVVTTVGWRSRVWVLLQARGMCVVPRHPWTWEALSRRRVKRKRRLTS